MYSLSFEIIELKIKQEYVVAPFNEYLRHDLLNLVMRVLSNFDHMSASIRCG